MAREQKKRELVFLSDVSNLHNSQIISLFLYSLAHILKEQEHLFFTDWLYILFTLQVLLFSDSLLRPYAQETISAPPNFYINCTPGGKAKHITKEMNAATVNGLAGGNVYFVVGTNNIKDSLYEIKYQFSKLIACAKLKFPSSFVSIILPFVVFLTCYLAPTNY